MNIQIDGVNNSNKGAQLMLFATLAAIEQYYPKATVRFNSPLSSSLFLERTKLSIVGVQPYWYKRWILDSHIGLYISKLSKRIYAAISNWRKTTGVDLLIDIGGFQFGDQWNHSERDILTREYYLKHLKSNGTKIVFMPQAFGPFEKTNSKKMLKVINDYSDMIIARDDISYKYLIDSGVNASIVSIYPDFTHQVCPVKPAIEDKYTGNVCIIPNSMMIRQNIVSEDTYVHFMTDVCKLILANGRTPFLFNHEGAGDLQLCHKINVAFSNSLTVYTGLNALETKWVISQSYLVISSRFHGVANALSSAVPCLATSWNHKYQKLFENYRLIDNVLDCCDFNDAKEKMENYLSESENKKTRKILIEAGCEISKANKEMWSKVFAQ